MSYIGTTTIGGMFLGGTEIAKAYLGSDLVFQKGGPAPLPYDAEVAYLTGTGTQYIDSGIECTGDLSVECRAYWPTDANTAIAGGLKQVSGNIYFRHHFSPMKGNNSNQYWYQQSNSSTASIRTNTSPGAFYSFSLNGSTGAWSLGSASGTVTTVSASSTTGKSYGIFARIANTGALQSKASSWAWCKLSKGGVLLRDFVAVRKNGVGYFYDKVSGELFPNAGTGSFTLGPDMSEVNQFRDPAVLTSLPVSYVLGAKQGACTDGTYIYQFNYGNCTGIKYNIASGTYTVTSLTPATLYGHGNDMTYNPVTGHIYLAPMTADGNLIELDTDWNYVATHTLLRPDSTPATVWGIAYDQNTGHYLSPYGEDKMLVYDASFTYLSTINMMRFLALGTSQGIETDGQYIYRVWSNPNAIDVATFDGRYVTHFFLPDLTEPETLMYDWGSGKYYVNNNGTTDFLYEAQIKV